MIARLLKGFFAPPQETQVAEMLLPLLKSLRPPARPSAEDGETLVKAGQAAGAGDHRPTSNVRQCDAYEEILALHRRYGVRLEHSVVFLLRTLCYEVTEVAREAGCARSLLYKALSGERSAPELLRKVVRRKIGVDPWEMA